MKPPRITTLPYGYDFDWDDHEIKIAARRLSMRKEEVKGEITITCNKAEGGSHLKQCSYNFSADSSRRKMATELNSRYQPNGDVSDSSEWEAVIEQTCFYTLKYFRKGDDVVEINTSEASIKKPEYVLEPFLIKNYPSILFGDWSASKSTNAILMAACCSLPWYDNPMGWEVPARPMNVLYLDWETDSSTITWTSHVLTNGMGLGYFPLFYRRCTLPLARDLEQISECIEDYKADITILDSLGMAAGGDANATEPAFEFWSAWRKLKTTSLILAHNSKSTEDNNKRSVFGSQFYSAGARSIWEIRKNQEAGSNKLEVGFFNRKPPPFDALRQPFGIQIEFSSFDKMIVKAKDGNTIDDFMDSCTNSQRIKNVLLRAGNLTIADLAMETGLKAPIVTTELNRLKNKGVVVKLPDSTWGVTSNG